MNCLQDKKLGQEINLYLMTRDRFQTRYYYSETVL